MAKRRARYRTHLGDSNEEHTDKAVRQVKAARERARASISVLQTAPAPVCSGLYEDVVHARVVLGLADAHASAVSPHLFTSARFAEERNAAHAEVMKANQLLLKRCVR